MNQPAPSSAFIQPIQPVQLFPEANAFAIVNMTGIPPVIVAHVGVFKPGSPAIPQKGVPGRPGFELAVPAVPDRLDSQKSFEVQMTSEEFDAWTTEEANSYLTAFVAKKLGFTVP